MTQNFFSEQSQRAYARTMADAQGQAWYVFRVPTGTLAYEHGARFGSFGHHEKADYAPTVEIVATVKPVRVEGAR